MTEDNKANLQVVYEQLNGTLDDLKGLNEMVSDAIETVEDCITRLSAVGVNSANDEVTKLRGEIGVLVGLLKEALQVIETVDGEDADECNRLMELQNKMGYAILGASV
jgi:hypothetical protein